ncbi:hypothetical protein WDW37_13120 [Bdellovibrionota bacterium FG-1]
MRPLHPVTAILLLLPLLMTSSCGSEPASVPAATEPAPTDQSMDPSPPSSPTATVEVDGQPPYRGFRGQDVHGDNNFATLINSYLQGRPDPAPWAAFWWPYTANGIASGSYGGGSSGMNYSPAGKYDAARGHATQAQEWEVKNHGARVPKVQGWWGHCNGWCAASALYKEPRASVKVNGIEFSVADIKGLLAEAGMSASADFFGNRLDPWTRDYQKAMDDTVADQYFLVLTNFMGKLKQAVLIDRFTGDQIWNQPLAGYRFKYPTAADYLGCTNNVCKINLESTIWWYNDSGVPANVLTPEFKWEDILDPQSGAELVQHRELRMELWLDGPVEFGTDGKISKSGNVIVTRDPENPDFFVGGAWKDGALDYADGHPDYMWVPYSLVPPSPTEDYANPHVDIEWIKKHLLVPGGADDPSARPSPLESSPTPHPTSSSWPTPTPSSTYSPVPPLPMPTHSPIPWPTPTATWNPHPAPWPTPTRSRE